MRYNIQAITNKNFVHFSEELEYIKAYLGMQRKNYPQVDISIEDKVVEFKVPFNTIEPLVENAFNRIVAKDSGEGRIVVRGYERLDCFAIQIVDNGKGPGPDKKFDKRYSFKDIKKRLKTMCNAVIEINNKPEKGTIVTVKVPKEGFIIKE
jgi:LytS/YehU family sensor histidine kinase